MTDKIIKHEGARGTIETLRLLMTLDGDDSLSIAKTAVKDGTKGLVARGISVLQRWNEARFGEALLQELEEMRSAGKIREDFNQTDAGVSSLREFFEMIDGKPDEERFHAFCALFMSANGPDADSSEAIFDIELMSIIRQLTAGEMHLLSACLKVRFYTVGVNNLMELLSRELGYKSEALVNKNVTALLEHGLIEKVNWNNRGGHQGIQKPLLTDLGTALSHRIEKYNEFKTNK